MLLVEDGVRPVTRVIERVADEVVAAALDYRVVHDSGPLPVAAVVPVIGGDPVRVVVEGRDVVGGVGAGVRILVVDRSEVKCKVGVGGRSPGAAHGAGHSQRSHGEKSLQ